jgi:hypothetical protein
MFVFASTNFAAANGRGGSMRRLSDAAILRLLRVASRYQPRAVLEETIDRCIDELSRRERERRKHAKAK